jgi:hypothetical protein
MSMPSDGEQPERRALLRRLRGSYVSSSLMTFSIIQGVALAALGATVAANHARLTAAQWLLAFGTFGAGRRVEPDQYRHHGQASRSPSV